MGGLRQYATVKDSTTVKFIWEFPKIGDPNIVPKIVRSLLSGPQNTVPLIFRNSHIYIYIEGRRFGVRGKEAQLA